MGKISQNRRMKRKNAVISQQKISRSRQKTTKTSQTAHKKGQNMSRKNCDRIDSQKNVTNQRIFC